MRRAAALLAAGALVLSGCGGGSGTSRADRLEPTARPDPPPALSGRWAAGASSPVEDSVYPRHGDHGVDVLHYGLDLRWERTSHRLTGDATLRLRVVRASRDGFGLDLGRALRASRVTLDGDDVTARTGHPGDHLVVGVPVTAGEHTLRVRYAGVPRPVEAPTDRPDVPVIGWTTEADGEVHTMQEPYGAFTWYPANDQPSDKALYDVRVDAPGRWVGVSNGRLLSLRRTAGRTVTRWRLAHPASSYLATVAIGPYRRHSTTGPHGLPITSWVRPVDRGALRVVASAPRALRFLEERLGPLPSDRAGFVVVPGASGMETQDMITLGRESIADGDDAVVLHELAHQWYGDAVTPRDWRDVWMNEGMATYLQLEWAVATQGQSWPDLVGRLRDQDRELRRRYGPPGDYDPAAFAQGNVYVPAALMWRTLRGRLGATRFDDLRRRWIQENRFTNRDRDELVAWWSRAAGQDLSRFFAAWLTSRTTPSTEGAV